MLQEAFANKLQLDELKRCRCRTAAARVAARAAGCAAADADADATHAVASDADAVAATAPAVRATRQGLRRAWCGRAEAAEQRERVVLAGARVHGVDRAVRVAARILSRIRARARVWARVGCCCCLGLGLGLGLGPGLGFGVGLRFGAGLGLGSRRGTCVLVKLRKSWWPVSASAASATARRSMALGSNQQPTPHAAHLCRVRAGLA